MIIKEIKEITEKREVIAAYKCDVCGKTKKTFEIPDDWHEITAYHNGWGNDSIDSYDYFLVCSPKCYIESIQKALIDFEEYKDDGAEVDGFKIEFLRNLINELK